MNFVSLNCLFKIFKTNLWIYGIILCVKMEKTKKSLPYLNMSLDTDF